MFIDNRPLNNTISTRNLAIVRATTTNAGDSIKFTSANGTALSTTNPATATVGGTTAGQGTTFTITADVTILLTGAHWGAGTRGDLTGALLRALLINDNGTLKYGVAYLGGRDVLLTTDTNATTTNITLPEYVLCNSAIGSATNTVLEVGYVRANFDDTGGAAEDLWAIQTGIGDVVTGKTCDGLWQPWRPVYTGFSADPTYDSAGTIWCQIGQAGIVKHTYGSQGTSNATGFTIEMPFKAGSASEQFGYGTNNSAALTSPVMIEPVADSRTLNLYKDASAAVWTNTGTKTSIFSIEVKVGPVASFIE